MYKRFVLGCVLICLAAGLALGQQFASQRADEGPWWYTLERGKQLFRSGSYGDAHMAFEDARRGRLDQFTRMEQNLIIFLSRPDVRQLGDSLEFVEWYIAERSEAAADATLAYLYHRVPKESLGGSVRRALEELDRLKNYPEAEYWLGETYRVEGELAMALRQYERAWNYRALLEVPGFDVEILHKITDIHRIRRDYQEMEKWIYEIIQGPGPGGGPRDSFWTGESSSPSGPVNQIRASMTRILENEGVNRFLTLYRYNNIVTERAHRMMGFFCYSSNRHSLAAEHLMFAFLIQNTVLIEEIIRRQFDFEFTSLANLEDLVRTRPELLEFLEETEYYRTMFYLATSLFATGKTRPSRDLWTFLAASGNAGVWGERARRSPTPYIERPIDMR